MSNFEIADRLDGLDILFDRVNQLLEVGVDDILLSYGRINPYDGTEEDRMQTVSLCHDLPKAQAILTIAQEEVSDIQKQIQALYQQVQHCGANKVSA